MIIQLLGRGLQHQHTTNCQNYMALWQKRREDWLLAHPHYCRGCKGAGQFVSYYDPSAAGVSLSSGFMTDIDPCPDCTEKGICPLCGEPGLTSDPEDKGIEVGVGPCTFCGFNYDDGLPELPGCICSTDIYEQYCDLYYQESQK